MALVSAIATMLLGDTGMVLGELGVCIAGGIVAAGFVLKGKLSKPIRMPIVAEAEAAQKAIIDKYEDLLEEAVERDEDARAQRLKDKNAACAAKREQLKPELDKLREERAAAEKTYNEICILSQNDVKDIDELIDILQSHRANNIKEALQEWTQEKQRREEEARAAAEAEAVRRASMPGTVHYFVGSISIKGGVLRPCQNKIYVDGLMYGAGNGEKSSIQLNPGAHSIYARIPRGDYLYTTPTYSFNLQGGEEINLKFKLDQNGCADVERCGWL